MGGKGMSKLTTLNQAFALGFDEVQQALERITRMQPDGYPPFNILREKAAKDSNYRNREHLRIVIAVAGFHPDQLDVTLEGRQLTVRGLKAESDTGDYLHQGIATRQFQRSFLLADTVEVQKATLKDGLLNIELIATEPEISLKKIKIYCD